MTELSAVSSVSSGLARMMLEQALKEGKVIEIPSLDIAIAAKPYCVERWREEFVTFETAHEVALYLWGEGLSRSRVYKNGRRFPICTSSGELSDLTFENARDVVEHLWGEYLPRFALFKNGEAFLLKGGEFEEMVKRLGA